MIVTITTVHGVRFSLPVSTLSMAKRFIRATIAERGREDILSFKVERDGVLHLTYRTALLINQQLGA